MHYLFFATAVQSVAHVHSRVFRCCTLANTSRGVRCTLLNKQLCMRAHISLLLAACLAPLYLSAPGAWAWHTCSKQAIYPGRYGHTAVKLLTEHRSTILSNVWQTFKLDGGPRMNHYDPFKPYLPCPPPHPKLVRYGAEGDGGKLLCPLPNLALSASCVVVSMGSRGDYSFESHILNTTKCEIHTYDCTYRGKSLDPARHTYHKVCIGESGWSFKSWKQVSEDWGGKHVAVAKIDIEGHESTLLSQFQPGMNLPSQIVMEMHLVPRIKKRGAWKSPTPRTTGELGLVFMHLASLGYGIVAKEPNPYDPNCCAEYTFMLVENTMSGRRA